MIEESKSYTDVLLERPKTNLGCASKRFLAPSGYKNHSHEQKCVRRRSQSQTFTRTRQSAGLETKAKQKQCRSSKQSEKEVTHQFNKLFNKDFFQIKQNTSPSSSSPVTVIEPAVHSTSTLTQFDSFHAFVFFKTKGSTNQTTPIRHFGGAFTHRSGTRTRYSRQHMLEVNWKCTARALVF